MNIKSMLWLLSISLARNGQIIKMAKFGHYLYIVVGALAWSKNDRVVPSINNLVADGAITLVAWASRFHAIIEPLLKRPKATKSV